MNGLMNFIKDNFSAFLEAMMFIPSEFQIWYVSEVAVLVIILVLALGVIFLCDRLIKKYNLGFTASVLLTFLILSLTLALTGLIISIPRLYLSAFDFFLVVGIGSPAFNIVLSMIATLGNRLHKNYPIAGTLLLCGVGFLFAWILIATFVLFILGLYNY